jgi:hypothetical protein
MSSGSQNLSIDTAIKILEVKEQYDLNAVELVELDTKLVEVLPRAHKDWGVILAWVQAGGDPGATAAEVRSSKLHLSETVLTQIRRFQWPAGLEVVFTQASSQRSGALQGIVVGGISLSLRNLTMTEQIRTTRPRP